MLPFKTLSAKPRGAQPHCTSWAASSFLHSTRNRATRGVLLPALASVAADGGQQGTVRDAGRQASSTTQADSAPSTSGHTSTSPLLVGLWARKLTTAKGAADVADLISQDWASAGTAPRELTEDEGKAVLVTCLERGREDLALGIYKEMCSARRSSSGSAVASGSGWDLPGLAWPSATLQITTALVLGLCRSLSVSEALQVLADIKGLGMPSKSAEVGFGKVINCPLAPDTPLAVVQPQEGYKVVADSVTKYEYELFSGSVTSCSSEALQAQGNLLLSAARAVGLIKKPPVAAVHTFVVRAPDGTSRTFRVGTESASVPAQKGERITMVSSPSKNVRKGGFFNASPPGTKPGEGLAVTNHSTGQVLQLLRPPVSNTQTGLPSWVLPTAVLLAGGDAASSLLDPNLPLLLAAGAVSLVGAGATGTNVLVPRLKQLPENRLRAESVRQRLLGQYSSLADKVAVALQESGEDVRVLARLWQLQNKMEAVGAAAASSAATTAAGGAPDVLLGYRTRIERVAAARSNIEQRLVRRVELLDGYSRVMSMIEIEVEMDLEVPAAELAGIEEQIGKLSELESLQEDWRTQAEARDEVERLLRL